MTEELQAALLPKPIIKNLTNGVLDITNLINVDVTIPNYNTTTRDDDILYLFNQQYTVDADISTAIAHKPRGTQPVVFTVDVSTLSKTTENNLWYRIINDGTNFSDSEVTTFTVTGESNMYSIIFDDAVAGPTDDQINSTITHSTVETKGTRVTCYIGNLKLGSQITITLTPTDLNEEDLADITVKVSVKPLDVKNGYLKHTFNSDAYDYDNVSSIHASFTILATTETVDPIFASFKDDSNNPNIVTTCTQGIGYADFKQDRPLPSLTLNIYGGINTFYTVTLTGCSFANDLLSRQQAFSSGENGIVRIDVVAQDENQFIKAEISNNTSQLSPAPILLEFNAWYPINQTATTIDGLYSFSSGASADGVMANYFYIFLQKPVNIITLTSSNSAVTIENAQGLSGSNRSVYKDGVPYKYVWFKLTAKKPCETDITIALDGAQITFNDMKPGIIQFTPVPKRLGSVKFVKIND